MLNTKFDQGHASMQQTHSFNRYKGIERERGRERDTEQWQSILMCVYKSIKT